MINEEVFFRECFLNKVYKSLIDKCKTNDKTMNRKEIVSAIVYTRISKKDTDKILNLLEQDGLIEKVNQQTIRIVAIRTKNNDVGCWVSGKKDKL